MNDLVASSVWQIAVAFFLACDDLGIFFVFFFFFFLMTQFPSALFLKWKSARAHQFHSLCQISPQWLSELRRLWPSVPWWVACELVSFVGSHTMPWTAKSALTPSDFVCSRVYYACLGVICLRRFWQDSQGLLRATAATRGWNGHRMRVGTQSYLWRRKFSHRESNLQPFDHEPGTLPTELTRPPLLESNIIVTWWSYIVFSNPADLND